MMKEKPHKGHMSRPTSQARQPVLQTNVRMYERILQTQYFVLLASKLAWSDIYIQIPLGFSISIQCQPLMHR